MRLQPDEGIKLWLMLKKPGAGGMRMRHVPLDMDFARSLPDYAPEAYERLLMDVIRGNPTLFMRRDEVEAAWRWVDPIREAWNQSPLEPRLYLAGTWGPASAPRAGRARRAQLVRGDELRRRSLEIVRYGSTPLVPDA